MFSMAQSRWRCFAVYNTACFRIDHAWGRLHCVMAPRFLYRFGFAAGVWIRPGETAHVAWEKV